MIVPYEAFPIADGWVMIARRLRRALRQGLPRRSGAPELAARPALRGQPARASSTARRCWRRSPRVTRALTTADAARAAAARPACRRRPSHTIDQVARRAADRGERHAASRRSTRALPDYRAVGLPIQWDGERPGVAPRAAAARRAHRRGAGRARLRRRRHPGPRESAMSSSYRTLDRRAPPTTATSSRSRSIAPRRSTR